MSPGGAAQPLQVGAPSESWREGVRPGTAPVILDQPQPEDDPMSPEGAAQLLHLGAPEDHPSPGSAAQPLQVCASFESRMEEDLPCQASTSPDQPQPEDDPMSPEGAA